MFCTIRQHGKRQILRGRSAAASGKVLRVFPSAAVAVTARVPPALSAHDLRAGSGADMQESTSAQSAQELARIPVPLQHLHQGRADHDAIDVAAQPLDLIAAADAEARTHRQR